MLAFGHMLPHSVGVLESIGRDKNIAFKFTLVGYLLVFFIEKIAFNSHALLHEVMDDKGGEHSGHSHSHNIVDVQQATNNIAANVQSVAQPDHSFTAPTASSSSATIIESVDIEVSTGLHVLSYISSLPSSSFD